jgi:D-glycero-D-manno-heptose 1,7-bisphosphate phosphatase
MLNMAADLFSIDLANSWIIGDKADDLKAGINAGLCGGIQVGTRYRDAVEERKKTNELVSDSFTIITVSTVEEAFAALPILSD